MTTDAPADAARERDAASDAVTGAGHDHDASLERAGHGAITDPPSTMTVAPVIPPLLGAAKSRDRRPDVVAELGEPPDRGRCLEGGRRRQRG